MLTDPLNFNIDLTEKAPAVDLRPPKPRRFLLTQSPDHPDDYILEIDYTGIATFLNCARSYENANVKSRLPATDGSATSFGDLFHRCEELRLIHGPSDEIVTKQRELVALHFASFHPAPDDHRTADRMVDVLNKYNSLYSNDQWWKKVLVINGQHFVERPFKLPLCTLTFNDDCPYPKPLIVADTPTTDLAPFRVRNLHIVYTGKIDVVLEEAGYYWVVDHKTSSRGGKQFEDAFILSLQTRGYAYVAQQLTGLPIMGLIVNGIIIRPLTRTGVGTEFMRKSNFYSPDSLGEWKDDMLAHVADLANSLMRGFFPQTALSFDSPCKYCKYLENCSLPRAQRPADLASGLFQDNTWDPTRQHN